ncbi:MAG: dTDP-glucose 4,6-dehydratase [Planctomycetota bacterium]
MHILLTGGSGFIGSNFVRFALSHTDHAITNLDVLTYSGNPENLRDIEDDPNFRGRYTFVEGNILDRELAVELMSKCDAVVHMAAESHVDRSIMDARPFVETNVLGTQTLLDALRSVDSDNTKPFIHVSTDEVFGDLPLDQPDLKFHEDTPYAPSSPYSSSKAASDMIAKAYHHTFGMDVRVTNCSNNFGPYQFPEKVIPVFVTNILEGQKLPLYGDGKNVRDWLHVDDHAEAILAVLDKGTPGSSYCIGGNNERSNLELTHSILQIMGKDESWITPVTDRLGHDRRYAIDATKIETELGWTPSRSAWPDALDATVKWYVDNPDWIANVKSGAYRDYYAKQYGS